jgi:hypothetical protein
MTGKGRCRVGSAAFAPDHDLVVGDQGRQILHLIGRRESDLELGDALTQRVYLVLELDDSADAFEAQPLGGEASDLTEQLNVSQRVAASTTTRTTRDDKLEAVVRTQRLRVKA